jgi:hypothetical protein
MMNKKKFLIIGGSVGFLIIILVASLLYAITVSDKKAKISAEYSIAFEVGKEGETSDFIVYSVLVSNESEKPLVNFNVDITLDEQMKEFTPLQKFITEPIYLRAFDSQKINQNKIMYSKKSAIAKLSSMKKEQVERLNGIYPNLKIKMSWFGGSKDVSLSKNDLTNSSVLDLTKITQ